MKDDIINKYYPYLNLTYDEIDGNIFLLNEVKTNIKPMEETI